MNLAELQEGVLTRGGWPQGDALYTPAVLTQLVNAALHHIETEHDWGWLEHEAPATVDVDGFVDPPEDWQRTITLRHPSGYPLRKVEVAELDLLADASGTPKLWASSGALIAVVPHPDAPVELRHRYIRSEPGLVDDSDAPLIPARFHQAVIEYATYLAYRREGNLQEAGGALAAYETWREQMRKVASRYSPSTGGGEPVAMSEAEAAAAAKAARA